MILELKDQLYKHMSQSCSAAFLYGSQLSNPTKEGDIDLVLIYKDGQKDQVVQKLSKIQQGFPCLLHAIFVHRQDLERNPQLKKLVCGASPLWQGK